MAGCFVCTSLVSSQHGHHVVPQAADGEDGPQVDLCGTCHNVVHSAALKIMKGKPPDALLAHLEPDARDRALGLAAVAAKATTVRDGGNPHPLLTVKLDDPAYMMALDMLKLDRGLSSRSKLINSIARELAIRYGLIDGGESQKRGTYRLKTSK